VLIPNNYILLQVSSTTCWPNVLTNLSYVPILAIPFQTEMERSTLALEQVASLMFGAETEIEDCFRNSNKACSLLTALVAFLLWKPPAAIQYYISTTDDNLNSAIILKRSQAIEWLKKPIWWPKMDSLSTTMHSITFIINIKRHGVTIWSWDEKELQCWVWNPIKNLIFQSSVLVLRRLLCHFLTNKWNFFQTIFESLYMGIKISTNTRRIYSMR
jgi:hypothetical protein